MVVGDVDLTAGNIRQGANIFGVAGASIQASGNAVAGDVVPNKTFSNGRKRVRDRGACRTTAP